MSNSDTGSKRARGRRRGRRGGSRIRERSAASREPEHERSRVRELCTLTPFAVFCAVHLGITEHDGYTRQSAAAVARRFGLGEGELEDYLEQHALGADVVQRAGFDLDSARIDVEVAPAGISRTELARPMFAEFEALRERVLGGQQRAASR